MVKVKKFKFVNSFYLENINRIIKENPILEFNINFILNVAKNNFQNTNLNIINRLVLKIEIDNICNPRIYNDLHEMMKNFKYESNRTN